MSVSLPNNFFLNARGLTFEDSTSVTWALDRNRNQLSATVISAIPAGANPTASVGLVAVNGTATTFMRSDAAPALSVAIIPTWTGLHTFGAGLTVSAGNFTLNGHQLTLSADASVGGTNTGDQVIPVGANPTGSVGLAATNGVATSLMRSDAAPALSVAIAPTWTGTHAWTQTVAGAFVQVVTNSSAGTTSSTLWRLHNDMAHDFQMALTSSGYSGAFVGSGPSGEQCVLYTNNAIPMVLATNGTARIMIAGTGAVTVLGKLGVNGATPPAQVTGWGTPTGQAVVASFAAGATPSLLQMSEAVAQIITDLKAFGIYGA